MTRGVHDDAKCVSPCGRVLVTNNLPPTCHWPPRFQDSSQATGSASLPELTFGEESTEPRAVCGRGGGACHGGQQSDHVTSVRWRRSTRSTAATINPSRAHPPQSTSPRPPHGRKGCRTSGEKKGLDATRRDLPQPQVRRGVATLPAAGPGRRQQKGPQCSGSARQ